MSCIGLSRRRVLVFWGEVDERWDEGARNSIGLVLGPHVLRGQRAWPTLALPLLLEPPPTCPSPFWWHWMLSVSCLAFNLSLWHYPHSLIGWKLRQGLRTHWKLPIFCSSPRGAQKGIFDFQGSSMLEACPWNISQADKMGQSMILTSPGLVKEDEKKLSVMKAMVLCSHL